MCSCMAACILDDSQAWARRVQRLEDERRGRGRGRKEAAPALWRGGGGRGRKKKNTSAASSHPPRREKKAGTCWGRGTDAAASPAPGHPIYGAVRLAWAGRGPRTCGCADRLPHLGVSWAPPPCRPLPRALGMIRACFGSGGGGVWDGPMPCPALPPHPSSKSRQAPPPALAGGGPIRAGPESTSKSRQAPPPALAGDGPDRGRPLGRRARWVSWVHAGRLSGRRQRRPLAEAAVGGGKGEGRRGGERQGSSGKPAGACAAAAPPIPRPPLLRRPRRPPTLFLPLRAFAGGTCP